MFIFENSLLTGIDTVDSQHRSIFEIVNEFYCAVQQGKGYHAARGLLFFLANYVNSHFSDEEELMAEIGYEKYLEHCSQHARLTEQMNNYIQKSDVLDENILNDITHTVVDWLNDHIKNEDKDFARQYTLLRCINPGK